MSHNLLVISDLHLGEDLKPTTRDGLHHLALLERELEAFLRHYTETRRDERPWRLVVNGDMVDFLSVTLMPDEAEVVTGLHPEDHTWGLGGREVAATAKMQRVLARHAGVFRAFAEFVGRGNDLAVIVGNHDVEFYWPRVQRLFVDALAQHWSVSGLPGRTVAEVEAAVAFHPWFFFEAGVIWIEHGHQYDAYCSFEEPLDPVDPTEDELELNVGSAAMRYIGNHYTTNPGANADLGFVAYLGTLVGRGVYGTLAVLGAYGAMLLRLFGQWAARVLRKADFDARKKQHLERLRTLARRAHLPEDKVLALYKLRKPPIFMDFGRLMQAVMLDRLLVTLLALALVPALVVLLPWSWSPAGTLLLFAAAGLAHHLLSRTREDVDPGRTMRKISKKIRKLVRAPIVVFGHSHVPIAHQGRDGGWYFNTGTWVVGPESGILKAFTHLIVDRREHGVRPALCQWRNGRSVLFTGGTPRWETPLDGA